MLESVSVVSVVAVPEENLGICGNSSSRLEPNSGRYPKFIAIYCERVVVSCVTYKPILSELAVRLGADASRTSTVSDDPFIHICICIWSCYISGVS